MAKQSSIYVRDDGGVRYGVLFRHTVHKQCVNILHF
jgi:hypothetical protein